MLLQQLQEKEKFLTERITRLKSSIAEVESEVEVRNIEQKAQELGTLQVQLKLTESALQDTHSKLTERIELEGSKEFKDKVKQAQELRRQAQKQTTEVFENLKLIQKQVSEVFKKVNQVDKLNRETGEKHSYVKLAQPFAWLGLVKKHIDNLIKQTSWLRDKLS